eukprot:CAMPEP_0168438890 /NCGR_PEP_ID=MMETSP0228-20121227/42191_1 /TAXON_ID=133427 /ORGANISM="Protoceratium reticulatum, Strain CCCM 535 (=CCMP 1889)" /LENGTH=88 /DNA_ID=CAMNT_0008453165 /DNA_START=409 /DNA_END=671 /DNA_ORIENTATION=+
MAAPEKLADLLQLLWVEPQSHVGEGRVQGTRGDLAARVRAHAAPAELAGAVHALGAHRRENTLGADCSPGVPPDARQERLFPLALGAL